MILLFQLLKSLHAQPINEKHLCTKKLSEDLITHPLVFVSFLCSLEMKLFYLETKKYKRLELIFTKCIIIGLL